MLGTATWIGPGGRARKGASRAARSSKGLGASLGSLGWSRVAISNLGQAPPESATSLRSPTFTVVRSMGQCVPQVLSGQANWERSVSSACRALERSIEGEAESSRAPSWSSAHSPMPQAPIAPGLGGTTMSRPVTDASAQAREGLDAGLPWKKMVGASVRWPITRCR